MQRFGGGGSGPATGDSNSICRCRPRWRSPRRPTGASSSPGTNYEITATASSPNGDGDQGGLLRRQACWLAPTPPSPTAWWSPTPPPGTNSLVAVVTDSAGVTATSTTVQRGGVQPGADDHHPGGRHDLQQHQSDHRLGAYVLLPSGTMTNVEFFVDGVKFGEDATAPFSAVWSNVTGGSHRLTAVGTGRHGQDLQVAAGEHCGGQHAAGPGLGVEVSGQRLRPGHGVADARLRRQRLDQRSGRAGLRGRGRGDGGQRRSIRRPSSSRPISGAPSW